MKRRTVLLAVTDAAQISSGLQPDRHSLHQPLWERAANVRFYQGKVRRLIPPSTLFDSGGPGTVLAARGLHQQQLAVGTKTTIIAYVYRTTTPPTPDAFTIRFYVWNGSTSTQIV